jgi:hypothetical protein
MNPDYVEVDNTKKFIKSNIKRPLRQRPTSEHTLKGEYYLRGVEGELWCHQVWLNEDGVPDRVDVRRYCAGWDNSDHDPGLTPEAARQGWKRHVLLGAERVYRRANARSTRSNYSPDMNKIKEYAKEAYKNDNEFKTKYVPEDIFKRDMYKDYLKD